MTYDDLGVIPPPVAEPPPPPPLPNGIMCPCSRTDARVPPSRMSASENVAPDDIPQELVDILDRRAGKTHSRTGEAVGCLAEILTRWEAMLSEQRNCPGLPINEVVSLGARAEIERLTRERDEARHEVFVLSNSESLDSVQLGAEVERLKRGQPDG